MPIVTVQSKSGSTSSNTEKRAWGFWQVRGEEGQSWLRGAGCFTFSYASQVQRLCKPTQKQPKVYFPPELLMLPEDIVGALTRRQTQLLWLFCSPLLSSLKKIAWLFFFPYSVQNRSLQLCLENVSCGRADRRSFEAQWLNCQELATWFLWVVLCSHSFPSCPLPSACVAFYFIYLWFCTSFSSFLGI